MQRFAIKRSVFWRWLLVLFTGTRSRSFVDVGDGRVYAQFGWWRITLPREAIQSIEQVPGHWWWGIGWRSTLRGTVALLGATNPVVCFTLNTPVRTRLMGIPMNLTTLYVSPENPNGLIAAVTEMLR